MATMARSSNMANQQENDLKAGIMPDAPGFGEDSPMYYGEVTYRNGNGDWIKNKLKRL